MKEESLNEDFVRKIMTAQYLMSEIEYQFGYDVAEFIVGYQCGLNRNASGFTKGEIPLLSKVGHYASEGYGEFFGEINSLMCDMDNTSNIYTHSIEATNFSKSVVELTSSERGAWYENYKKAIDNGFINQAKKGCNHA